MVPEETFKNPLLKYYYFIKYGAENDFQCYTPIKQKTVDNIIGLLPKKFHSLPFLLEVKEEFINVCI